MGSRSLRLRRCGADDVPELVEALQDSLPELQQFMPWSHDLDGLTEAAQLQRIEEANSSWNNRTDFLYHLYRPTPDGWRLSGSLGLHGRNLNPLSLEVGYWLRTEAAGQGLCTTAVRAIVLVGLDVMQIERIQVGCDTENVASRRVIERSGFLLEALLRCSLPATPLVGTSDRWLGSGNQWLFGLTQEDRDTLTWLQELHTHVTWARSI